MPKPTKNTRGGSKLGKVKKGRNCKGQRHSMRGLSVNTVNRKRDSARS